MKKQNIFIILLTILSLVNVCGQQKQSVKKQTIMKSNAIHYRTIKADGLNIFYREAGPQDAPVILLLHGYPTSSFMFRNLIPKLAGKYHVIAPDLPGFGFTESPSPSEFIYTFDNLAKAMQGFIDTLKLKRFALYVFDYGAPTGFRLAMANPEKITGIISQNGNAYEEGLGPAWADVKKYWADPSQKKRDELKDFVTIKMTRFQYEHGVSDLSLIEPEAYTLDQYFLDKPGHVDIQLDLMLDYRNNVTLYPKFQQYFRDKKPKLLAVWGNKDPFFLPVGAESYKKDIPDATVKFYDTGHFALETHADEIRNEILNFMEGLQK